MHLCLVIRHGPAEEFAATGLDQDRKLAADAMASTWRVAHGLSRISPAPELILTSPYARARETAELVAEAFGGVPVQDEPGLAAGSSAGDVLEALATACRGSSGRIALVGHEPDLGRFVSLALAASGRSFYPLHKCGACLLEFPAIPRAGNATLEWALEPSHLEVLGSEAETPARASL